MTTTSQTPEITAEKPKARWLPPRWVVRTAWAGHRAIYRFRGARHVLHPPIDGKWGVMRLATIGRQSGKARSAILGYVEDGPNLVTLAMNGWATTDPAWWRNLQARPEVTVELSDGKRTVRGREARGEERERLWAKFRAQSEWGDVDHFSGRRMGETAVVVLEPRP